MRIVSFMLRRITYCSLDDRPTIYKARGIFRRLFSKHLLLTNTFSSGILMGLGDHCQQTIEIYQAKSDKKTHDILRTAQMTTVGFGHGIFHHFFYGWMDRVLPGRNLRTVIRKVLIDQAIASPACMYIFFIGMAFLEGKGYSSGWQELKNKFLFTYMVDWIVWPPSQFINFYYISPQYRVMYINSLTMIYDVFLSYIKFYDENKEKQS